MRIFPVLFLLLLSPAAHAAQEDAPATVSAKGLTVELVTSSVRIAAGQTFYLGLWLQHEAGYHTYWQNPGLAGVPTKLAPRLPPGFSVGAMVYPPPDKVKMAAINVHGYERNVLVALPVTAPATLSPGPLTIPVEATWMCCRRTCNPGLAQLSVTVECGSSKALHPVWHPKFEALLEAQPKLLTGWNLSAIRSSEGIDLTLRPPAGQPLPEAPQFFSSDNLICSHPPQAWQKVGSGYSVRLALSDFQPPDPSHLRGLLLGQGSWGAGGTRAYAEIVVPISPTPP